MKSKIELKSIEEFVGAFFKVLLILSITILALNAKTLEEHMIQSCASYGEYNVTECTKFYKYYSIGGF